MKISYTPPLILDGYVWFALEAFAPMFLTYLPLCFTSLAPMYNPVCPYVLTPLPLSLDAFALLHIFYYFLKLYENIFGHRTQGYGFSSVCILKRVFKYILSMKS